MGIAYEYQGILERIAEQAELTPADAPDDGDPRQWATLTLAAPVLLDPDQARMLGELR